VLALAASAPVVVRGRRAWPVWYFGLTSIGAVLISGRVETPLHWLLYQVLPGFARLHPHAPERILTVAYLGPALLAGAALGAIWERRCCWPRFIRSAAPQRLAACGLVVVLVAADLTLAGARARSDFALFDPMNGADKLTPIDLSTYYSPDAGARFLQAQRTLDGVPTRYVGFAPYIDGETSQPWPYSTRFRDPTTAALQVDNRGLSTGLQDIQGYDASHLEVYDAYLAALNGRSQNYHDAEVFRTGLGSPLLDLLNVRYVIVPSHGYLDAAEATALQRFSGPVYADDRVRILTNPAALPRAWIVHAARQVDRQAALTLLGTGAADPRQVVLLDSTPPPTGAAAVAADERAAFTVDSADDLQLTTQSSAPGVLVFSEVYYPAWRAYVDGDQTPVLLADGALRAIALAPGSHTVELRYESTTLAAGTAVSATAALVCLGLVLSACARRQIRPSYAFDSSARSA
jgi:hypothetical protein